VAWAEKNREIQQSLKVLRHLLRESWLGNDTLQDERWHVIVASFAGQLDQVNKLVRSYNLSVPTMHLQRGFHSMEREVARLLEEIPPGSRPPLSTSGEKQTRQRGSDGSRISLCEYISAVVARLFPARE